MGIQQASLIYNPMAGALRRDPARIERLIAALSARGVHVAACATTSAGHATELARRAAEAGAEAVIVCGGDGTINEAAQALVGSETALAVWPCGTANVLAKELRLPRQPHACAELIAAGRARAISAGRAVKPETGWQRYFLLMAGIGLDAAIVQRVDLRLKRWAGYGAYLAAGLDYLARLPLTPFSLAFNEQTYESTFAVVANAASYGGWFAIAPQARLEADTLDVCLFNARSRLSLISYAVLSLTGSHTRRASVVYQAAREARANSNPAALVQLDGELAGSLPMYFEIVPQAWRIIAPQSRESLT